MTNRGKKSRNRWIDQIVNPEDGASRIGRILRYYAKWRHVRVDVGFFLKLTFTELFGVCRRIAEETKFDGW